MDRWICPGRRVYSTEREQRGAQSAEARGELSA